MTHGSQRDMGGDTNLCFALENRNLGRSAPISGHVCRGRDFLLLILGHHHLYGPRCDGPTDLGMSKTQPCKAPMRSAPNVAPKTLTTWVS
eukprot:s523_g35.t1